MAYSYLPSRSGSVSYTHLGRIGFTADDDMERAVAEMAEACALPGLVPVGVFTHFAAADSTAPEDIAYTRRQYGILCAAVEEMAARGCTCLLYTSRCV